MLLRRSKRHYPTLPCLRHATRTAEGGDFRVMLRRLVNHDRSVFFVAEDEGLLVGFIVATVEREIPIYRLQEFAFIQDIWVEPEYRQQGVAKQMVMLTVERCHQMGVKQIRLDTAAVNEAARRLFASCGFRISTQEMLMELNQESRVKEEG